MPNLLQSITSKFREGIRANETVSISIYDWAKMFQPGGQVNFGGMNYQAYTNIPKNSAFTSPIFTCERWRVSVFSEARFAWQRLRNGRPLPGDMFGTPELSILEKPWPGATTRDLLAVCEIDAAVHGNSYWVIEDNWFVRLEPCDVKVLTEAVVNPITGNVIGEQLVGYAVYEDNSELAIYGPEEIAHYKPMPSSNSQWVGASWIAACSDDVDADRTLTYHKRAAIQNGANLTHVVSVDPELSPTQFDNFVAKFNEAHKGPANAGKTLFIQGGTDIKAIGQTFESLALRETQGAGETRIASCSGVHPVIAGFSEGLAGSALNAGNYNSAKRNFVDGTIAPMWGAFVSSFGVLLKSPGADVRLWYDIRDIPFLREDVESQAAVLVENSKVVSVLITAGYEPDAVIKAVMSGDLSGLMGNHTGLYSVQLTQPGSETTPTSNANVPDANVSAAPKAPKAAPARARLAQVIQGPAPVKALEGRKNA